MVTPNLGLRLRDRLGPEASPDRSKPFEEVQNDMLAMTTDRFGGRLIAVGSELRADICQTRSELRQEMAQMDAGLRVALTQGSSNIRAEMSDRARGRTPLALSVLDRTGRAHGGPARVYAANDRALKRL